MEVKEIHTDDIKTGDSILCYDGKIRTVSSNYIKYDSFLGKTIFGGVYNVSYKKVLKIVKL